jgi:hypothetical protein
MKRFLITEEDKKHIRKLYNLNEETPAQEFAKNILNKALELSLEPKSDTSSPSNKENSVTDSSSTSIKAGKYFVHPNADNIKLNIRPSAVPLNDDAQKLIKSIFAEAGTPNLEITSTLRTYEDQARVNSKNRRIDIVNWYGNDVAKAWDRLKNNQKEFANFLRKRDESRGKLMSNHLSGFAIDVVPYSEKFASTAEKLMKQGNSGIKKVLREKGNNAVHIEFNFSVTDESGISSPSSSSTSDSTVTNTPISKQGIILDKNVDSSDYAIVFGGSPSNKYGAQFMYEQGNKYLKNKNVVYSNFENSLDSVINYIKSNDPNAKISSVSGFSAGGKNAWAAAKLGYNVGLIDPVVTDDAKSLLGNDLNGSLPQNIKMVSRQENWSGRFRPHGDKLNKIERSQPNIRRNVGHIEMPTQFFSEFASFV